MMLATNVSKEDFKRAYTDCLKTAWIFHSQENFNQAVAWNKSKMLTYNVGSDVEEEDDFETNASTINIFKIIQEIYAQEDPEKLQRWNEAWANDQGFEILDYAGDAIVDGNAVGEFARKYFDFLLANDNLRLKTNHQSVSFEHYAFKDALKETQKVLESENQPRFLYEAAFIADDGKLKTRCDVLELKPNNHVNLFEVKATSKVKKGHFFDVAYQIYILEKNGYLVDRVGVVTLNPDYVYGFDEEFNLSKQANTLFANNAELTYEEVIADIYENNLLTPFTNEPTMDLDLQKVLTVHETWKTKLATKLQPIQELSFIDGYRILDKTIGLEKMFSQLANYLSYSGSRALKLLSNESCQTVLAWKWNTKEQCFFYETDGPEKKYCSHVLPWYDSKKETIFNLTGIAKSDKAAIFYQTSKFYFDEISNLESIDVLNKFSDKHFRIFDTYKKQVQGNLKAKDILDINHLAELKRTLAEYYQEDEIYMFDFETAKWALPKFQYSKTYQQIPFQYSVDVIHDANYDYHQPETMYHHEFLSSQLTDPRPDFIVHLIEDMLLKHKKGIYVAYNKSFEQMVLKQLAVEFPRYAKPLLYIAHHTIDLMDFFKGKKADNLHQEQPWFLVYHPDFHGSYSIKKTQPALDNSLNYSDLIINKGDKASQTFREYVDGRISKEIWTNDLEPVMIKYCNRDTLAMVVILKQVENLLQDYEQERSYGKI